MGPFNLLLTFTLLLLVHSCPTYYDFGNSPCAFHVNYIDSMCENFNFQKCTWVVCLDDYYSEEGCFNEVTRVDYSWTGCTKRCCDETVTYSQNAGAITQCQAFLDSQFKTKLAIGLGVSLGAVFLLVLVACICCCPCACCRTCKKCLKNAMESCCGCGWCCCEN